jgi:hypothetical protein
MRRRQSTSEARLFYRYHDDCHGQWPADALTRAIHHARRQAKSRRWVGTSELGSFRSSIPGPRLTCELFTAGICVPILVHQSGLERLARTSLTAPKSEQLRLLARILEQSEISRTWAEPAKSRPCLTGVPTEGYSGGVAVPRSGQSKGVCALRRRSRARTPPKRNSVKTAAAQTLRRGCRGEPAHRRATSGATEQVCAVRRRSVTPEAELPSLEAPGAGGVTWQAYRESAKRSGIDCTIKGIAELLGASGQAKADGSKRTKSLHRRSQWFSKRWSILLGGQYVEVRKCLFPWVPFQYGIG